MTLYLAYMPLVLSGCFVFGLRGCVDPETGQGSVQADFSSQRCSCEPTDHGTVLLSCPFEFDLASSPGLTGGSGASLPLLTAEFESPLACAFFALFTDPLVVQFPDNVTNFAGQFKETNTNTMGALSIQSGIECIDTGVNKKLCAEPGHQLVIIELPEETQEGDFQSQITFQVTPPGAIDVKPILTGKIEVGGRTFYPVLLPCITDFADAPSVTIPTSTRSVMDLIVPLDGVEPCQETLDFFGPSPVPILAWPILGVLAVAMAGLGIRRLRRSSVPDAR